MDHSVTFQPPMVNRSLRQFFGLWVPPCQMASVLFGRFEKLVIDSVITTFCFVLTHTQYLK